MTNKASGGAASGDPSPGRFCWRSPLQPVHRQCFGYWRYWYTGYLLTEVSMFVCTGCTSTQPYRFRSQVRVSVMVLLACSFSLGQRALLCRRGCAMMNGRAGCARPWGHGSKSTLVRWGTEFEPGTQQAFFCFFKNEKVGLHDGVLCWQISNLSAFGRCIGGVTLMVSTESCRFSGRLIFYPDLHPGIFFGTNTRKPHFPRGRVHARL